MEEVAERHLWKKIGKKTQIPYRIVMQNKDIFSFAGIWEEFENDEGETVHTFMVFSTVAHHDIKQIHDRMPVILDRQRETTWLNPKASEQEINDAITQPFSGQFELYTVSPRINESSQDVPSLIIPTPPTDQFGNLTLFDQ